MIRDVMKCVQFNCPKMQTNGGCKNAFDEGYARWLNGVKGGQATMHVMPRKCDFAVEHLLLSEQET